MQQKYRLKIDDFNYSCLYKLITLSQWRGNVNPSIRRVSLAEFSRQYLGASTAACYEKPPAPVLRQIQVRQDGVAEHVFLAMGKPADDLTDGYSVGSAVAS
jgi:hypothetical protein